MERTKDRNENKIGGYFSYSELRRIKECMKKLDLFSYSQFIREAVIDKLNSLEE